MGTKIPVNEYLISQGRFRGLSEKDISHIQEKVDEYWFELEMLAARGDGRH